MRGACALHNIKHERGQKDGRGPRTQTRADELLSALMGWTTSRKKERKKERKQAKKKSLKFALPSPFRNGRWNGRKEARSKEGLEVGQNIQPFLSFTRFSLGLIDRQLFVRRLLSTRQTDGAGSAREKNAARHICDNVVQ